MWYVFRTYHRNSFLRGINYYLTMSFNLVNMKQVFTHEMKAQAGNWPAQLALTYAPGQRSHLVWKRLFPIDCCYCCSVAKACPTLCDSMGCPARLRYPWGFSRQEYSGGLPCPPLGELPNPGIFSCFGRWVLYHRATREALLIDRPTKYHASPYHIYATSELSSKENSFKGSLWVFRGQCSLDCFFSIWREQLAWNVPRWLL